MALLVPFPVPSAVTLKQLRESPSEGVSNVQLTQLHPSLSLEAQTLSLQQVVQLFQSLQNGETGWPQNPKANWYYNPEGEVVFLERFL